MKFGSKLKAGITGIHRRIYQDKIRPLLLQGRHLIAREVLLFFFF